MRRIILLTLATLLAFAGPLAADPPIYTIPGGGSASPDSIGTTELKDTNTPTAGLCLTVNSGDVEQITYVACGGSTTEAGLESQLTDVADVFTDNDGALADDDLSDDNVSALADVTGKAGTTTTLATTAAGFTGSVECVRRNASGDLETTGADCGAGGGGSNVEVNNGGTITNPDFTDSSSVTFADAAGTVTADLPAGSVGQTEIATGGVGSAEIATDAVNSGHIGTGAVAADEIATNAVGSAEIATDAVGQDEVSGDAIGISELDDGSDTPVAGESVVVATGATEVEYLPRVGVQALLVGDTDDGANNANGVTLSSTVWNLLLDGETAIVEQKDSLASFTFNATTAEVCYTGTPTITVNVLAFAHFRMNGGSGTPEFKLGKATASPVADGDEFGTSRGVGSAGGSVEPYAALFEKSVSLSTSNCLGILARDSNSREMFVMGTGWIIDGALVNTSELNEMAVWRAPIRAGVGQEFLEAQATPFMYRNGSVWIPGPATYTANDLGGTYTMPSVPVVIGGGVVGLNFNDAAHPQEGAYRENALVISPRAATTGGDALALANNSATASNNLVTIVDSGGLVIGEWKSEARWIQNLTMLGYVTGEVGMYTDATSREFGYLVAHSKATGVANEGGGVCISNSSGADAKTMITTSTCFAVDATATTGTYPNGRPFIDGNRNGVKDAGEHYIDDTIGNSHLGTRISSPADTTYTDVDRAKNGFTVAEVYCITDTGSASLQIVQQDGGPTNVFTSAVSCTSSGNSHTTFADGTIPADTLLDVTLSSVTGSPNHILITIDE